LGRVTKVSKSKRNGKSNRRSFDCAVRKSANGFAQDGRSLREFEREQATAKAKDKGNGKGAAVGEMLFG